MASPAALRRAFATHVNQTSGSGRFIQILECGARDGLQNEKGTISTATKAEFISKLAATGLRYIEAGAFVSPRWVPQMADTAQLLPMLPPQSSTLRYAVLTPNTKAVDSITSANLTPLISEVFVFGAASEGFSKANTNCTIAESIDRMAKTCEKAIAAGLKVRGSVSCIVGSPFERGRPDPALVRDMAVKMIQAGCTSISLADTVGVGNPTTVREVVGEVLKHIPGDKLAIHCHDTFGSGVANSLVAVEMGVGTVDASVAGLGGCPYSPGATGNVSTEDIVYALHGMGYDTGINVDALAQVGAWISEKLGRASISRAGNGIMARARLSAKEKAAPAA